MSLVEAESIYNSMLESGELDLMLPSNKGNWKADKNDFLAIYNFNMETLGFEEIDLDETEI